MTVTVLLLMSKCSRCVPAEARIVLKLFQLLSNRTRLATFASAICLLSPLAVHAQSRDIVQFGNDIVIHEGEETHDAVCFACSIEIDGTVHGDAVVFLGNLRVHGHAEHDAVVFLGNITLGDNASIDHDAVIFAGSLHTGEGATVGRDRVVFPLFVFLLPFLFLAGILVLIIWAVRALMYRNRPVYPMPPPRM